MIFTSLVYPLFLFLAVVVFHIIPQNKRAAWITLCGLLFYSFYAGGFLLFIAVEAVFVYMLGKRATGNARLFVSALSAVIGVLAYFKYRIMLINAFAMPLNFEPLSAEHLIIPLALSFYTFEFIHYLADMRRGTIEKHGFLEFMAFAVFFPTMVAGPIKRFQDFVPRLHSAVLSWELVSVGIFRITVGLAKKIVIADSMQVLVEPLVSEPDISSLAVVAAGLLAYSIKIYMDFSGYSDIAIGSAALFGIKVPENFSYPYFKTSIAQFWKSWHISLTRWIIDYIFIPLGGSKKGLALACLNTLIALGISGLWHGAAFNFAFWGLYHGILLILYRLYSTLIKPMLAIPLFLRPVTKMASGMLTFALVTIGWGFFIMPATTYFRILLRLAGD